MQITNSTNKQISNRLTLNINECYNKNGWVVFT